MRVAVIQMSCKTYDKKANFEIATPLIKKACENGAKLIALPELFNTGYCCYENEWDLAENFGGETEQFLRQFTEKYGVTFIAGFAEKSSIRGLNYDSVMYVSPEYDTDSYNKIYLWGAEKNRFLKGNTQKLWKCGQAVISPLICYEIGFPELSKTGALNGADILCCCSAFNKYRLYAWELNTRARALETGCYVLASNLYGKEDDLNYCGCSRIVAPTGNVIAQATMPNEVIEADIDLEFVKKQRCDLPYLRDIDTDFTAKLYSEIQK